MARFFKLFCLLIATICLSDGSITDKCISCLCDAIWGCRQGQLCEGYVCGPFRISWSYWSDGGKHTLPGVANDANDAYSGCSNDYNCAVRTIKGYMNRFGRDCNGDGQLTCFDYMAIHGRSPSTCDQGLPPLYDTAFKNCATDVIRQGGSGLSIRIRNTTTITNELLYEIKTF